MKFFNLFKKNKISKIESSNLVSSSNKNKIDDLNDNIIDSDFAKNWTLKELKDVYLVLYIYAFCLFPDLEENEDYFRFKTIFGFIQTRFIVMFNIKSIKQNKKWNRFSKELILSTDYIDTTKPNFEELDKHLSILISFTPQKKEEVLFIMKFLINEFIKVLDNSLLDITDEVPQLMNELFAMVSIKLGIALTDKDYELLHSKSLILEERLSNIM